MSKTKIPLLTRSNATEIIDNYSVLQVDPELLAHATYVLSEWLNDSAPLGEHRYMLPAEALLKLATLYKDRLK